MTGTAWVARAGASDAVRRGAAGFLAHLAHADMFAGDRDIFAARAPARLDVIGGIADYSGSLVLEWPLADATFVALQRDPRPVLLLRSGTRHAGAYLRELSSLSYHDARAYFAAEPSTCWAAYVAGAFVVLARELAVQFPGGAKILVTSTVPEGKGVSSSAALEVAAMTAICGAYGIALAPRDLALLCQKVENLVAGAPCGVMDQMTAALGESGRLLALLCQPAELQSHLELPHGLALWGIDSGIRHAVSDADYGTVRAAAFMGQRIVEELTASRVNYLAGVTPREFATVAGRIPERLTGREFLDRYHGISDPMTMVDSGRAYPVRAAAAHPVYEHARARRFVELLSEPADALPQSASRLEERAECLGQLMYEAHDSYAACGLGSDGTDTLVDLARRGGRGIYGAKITGGGRGGTVAILARDDAGPIVAGIAARYAQQSGRAARVFAGTSAGAARCGVHLMKRSEERGMKALPPSSYLLAPGS